MGRGVTPTKYKQELAERLKAARLMAGYDTQQAFAKALGVEWERYRKWESGRTPVPHQYVPLVCELLDIDPNFLFLGAPKAAARKTA
jgi:transcriptional regulator with XRE-family HTH domain